MRRALGLIALVAAGGTVVAACSGGGDAANASADRPTATATVAVKDLVATATTTGNLKYEAAYPISTAVAGTVTSLPKSGTVIKQGQALYSVDTVPVIRMNGQLPAWRDLQSGVSDGADVEQLESALRSLGFGDGMAVDKHWSWATTTAVMRWQKAQGMEQTGMVPRGRVLFTPGDVRIDSVPVHVGSSVGPGTPIAQIGSTNQVVTTTVNADVSIKIGVGDKVAVQFDDGTKATGTVTAVSQSAGQGGQGGGGGRSVTVGLGGVPPKSNSSGGAVSTSFSNVLATKATVVPISALVALSGGGYGVQKVAKDGSTSYVPVTPGTFANTDVAITSNGLKSGDTVGVTP